MSTPTPEIRTSTFRGHMADLEAAQTKTAAGAVWAAADRDRDRYRLTDQQHAIVAGRAEELIATLPTVHIPAQRIGEVVA